MDCINLITNLLFTLPPFQIIFLGHFVFNFFTEDSCLIARCQFNKQPQSNFVSVPLTFLAGTRVLNFCGFSLYNIKWRGGGDYLQPKHAPKFDLNTAINLSKHSYCVLNIQMLHFLWRLCTFSAQINAGVEFLHPSECDVKYILGKMHM